MQSQQVRKEVVAAKSAGPVHTAAVHKEAEGTTDATAAYGRLRDAARSLFQQRTKDLTQLDQLTQHLQTCVEEQQALASAASRLSDLRAQCEGDKDCHVAAIEGRREQLREARQATVACTVTQERLAHTVSGATQLAEVAAGLLARGAGSDAVAEAFATVMQFASRRAPRDFANIAADLRSRTAVLADIAPRLVGDAVTGDGLGALGGAITAKWEAPLSYPASFALNAVDTSEERRLIGGLLATIGARKENTTAGANQRGAARCGAVDVPAIVTAVSGAAFDAEVAAIDRAAAVAEGAGYSSDPLRAQQQILRLNRALAALIEDTADTAQLDADLAAAATACAEAEATEEAARLGLERAANALLSEREACAAACDAAKESAGAEVVAHAHLVEAGATLQTLQQAAAAAAANSASAGGGAEAVAEMMLAADGSVAAIHGAMARFAALQESATHATHQMAQAEEAATLLAASLADTAERSDAVDSVLRQLFMAAASASSAALPTVPIDDGPADVASEVPLPPALNLALEQAHSALRPHVSAAQSNMTAVEGLRAREQEAAALRVHEAARRYAALYPSSHDAFAAIANALVC